MISSFSDDMTMLCGGSREFEGKYNKSLKDCYTIKGQSQEIKKVGKMQHARNGSARCAFLLLSVILSNYVIQTGTT